MFNSGISASDLISSIKSEVDISPLIPNASYVMWLNSLHYVLYTEFIQEQKKATISILSGDSINTTSISIGNEESEVRFEDIYTIFADDIQLMKSTTTSSSIFNNTFFKKYNTDDLQTGDVIGLNITTPAEITIVYYVKPKLLTVSVDVISEGNVMVPIEFIDLVKARLRGEAYKVANEDSLSAKWINEYNGMLENFKIWLANKSPKYGM